MSIASASTREWTLAELAKFVAGEMRGNPNTKVDHIATLENAKPGSISHCSSSAHTRHLKNSKASIVVLQAQFRDEFDGNCIISEKSRLAYARIVDLLYPPSDHCAGVHPTAVIGKDCRIDKNVSIGANVVMGNDVEIHGKAVVAPGSVIEDQTVIGAGSKIGANSTVYRRTIIGKNCRFSAGTVLGAPGFSFEWNGSRWMPVRNIGSLTIGDDVDIGACVSIDRASVEETRIQEGVRIDNNCHIGHNVVIGEHTLIVANVSIGGSTKIGKRCVIGGHATIKDNISIVDGVTILGASVVTKSITEAGTYSSAVPAREAKKWNRTLVTLNKLNN